MKTTNWIILFALAIAFAGCKNKTTTTTQPAVKIEAFGTGIGDYVPPDPNAPTTFDKSLGVIVADKRTPYTVHATAADRRTFYDMFSDEAKFYVISVNQTWYWGDGQSDMGATKTHTYARGGPYNVTLLTDISFRGGSSKQIKASVDINVAEPQSDPVLTYTPMPSLNGTTATPDQAVNITFTNTGGREVIVKPVINIIENGCAAKPCTWMSFVPSSILVKNDGKPVTAQVLIKWSKSPQVGTYSIQIQYNSDLIISGWYLPWVNPADPDSDGIFSDGDNDGIAGNHPCRNGATTNCDDNCPTVSNADQCDQNNNGIGDVCQ